MRISDWSSDVCSSDLFTRNRLSCHMRSARYRVPAPRGCRPHGRPGAPKRNTVISKALLVALTAMFLQQACATMGRATVPIIAPAAVGDLGVDPALVGVFVGMVALAGLLPTRSEEHTSELQSLLRHSYA